MPKLSHLLPLVAAGALAAAGLSYLGLRAGPAQAQGPMSVPACQCSAATAVPAISTSLVHCVCGGMTCVVSQHAGTAAAQNLMHCVR